MHGEKNGKDLMSALDFIIKIGVDMPPSSVNLYKFIKLVPDYRPLVLERLFKIMDTDRDGQITITDYERMISRLQFGTLRYPDTALHFSNARDMSGVFYGRVNLDESFRKDSTFTNTRTCVLSYDGARQILIKLRADDDKAAQEQSGWDIVETVSFDDPAIDFLAGLTTDQLDKIVTKCPPSLWNILMGISNPVKM